jgi:hypothetical protein
VKQQKRQNPVENKVRTELQMEGYEVELAHMRAQTSISRSVTS